MQIFVVSIDLATNKRTCKWLLLCRGEADMPYIPASIQPQDWMALSKYVDNGIFRQIPKTETDIEWHIQKSVELADNLTMCPTHAVAFVTLS